MSLSLVRGGQEGAPAAVRALLRQIQGGRLPKIEDPPEVWHAVTAAIRLDLLDLSNSDRSCSRWRYKLTPEGVKQAGPVLRLIAGGRG